MLKDTDIAATIAVRDLAKARKFYEGTLGLEPASTEGDEAVNYRSGNARVLVYRSEFAGTNRATAATWTVGDDLDEIVGVLGKKGVSFEHYTFPGVTLEGDVHVMGDLRNAWFKDPEGNILALVGKRPAGIRTSAS